MLVCNNPTLTSCCKHCCDSNDVTTRHCADQPPWVSKPTVRVSPISPVSVQFIQLLSRVRLFATPWTAARQASLSITNSQSLLKLMAIESVMPSSHLILCHPLPLPSVFPNIRVFSNESALRIRWPKYWSFSFNISPSSEHSEPISQALT